MLCRVDLVRTDVSEELSASFIRVSRSGVLGSTLALTSIVPISPILVTVMKEALSSSKTSFLTRATRRNIPEDAILQIIWWFTCSVPCDTVSHGRALPHYYNSSIHTVPRELMIVTWALKYSLRASKLHSLYAVEPLSPWAPYYWETLRNQRAIRQVGPVCTPSYQTVIQEFTAGEDTFSPA
jgi:hypothetical protein